MSYYFRRYCILKIPPFSVQIDFLLIKISRSENLKMQVNFGPMENMYRGPNKQKWYSATFFANRFYNNPCPDVSEVDEMYADLLRMMTMNNGKLKTNARQIKDSLLNNIYTSGGAVYNVSNPTLMTFTFQYVDGERYVDYDDHGVEMIAYIFKNRWYQTDGYYNYQLSMVTHFPRGNSTYPFPVIIFHISQNPLLEGKYKLSAPKEMSYVIALVPEQPAPLFTPFNPRKETCRRLKSWGFTDELIHYFDCLVHLVVKQNRDNGLKTGEIMFHNYATDVLSKHKYHIPGNQNKKRTLKKVSTLIECANSANGTINIIYWKEDYTNPPSNPTPRDRLEYKKYMESQLIIRW